MSEASLEGSSYFDLPRRRHNRSTGSSEAISPLGSLAATPPTCRTRPPHPGLTESVRSRSDIARPGYKGHFDVIEEGNSTCHSAPVRTPIRSHPISDTNENESRVNRFHHNSARSSEYSPGSNKRPELRFSQSTTSAPDAGAGTGFLTSQQGYGSWRKALSGRYGNNRSTSFNDASSSSHDAQRAYKAIEVSRSSLQPLRPPSLATKQSTPLSEHRIKVEKSFTSLRGQVSADIQPEQISRRTSSINPKQLFSISVGAFRRFGRRSHDQARTRTQINVHRPQFSTPSAQDHKSSLRKEETAARLIRVTSMLQDVKRINFTSRSTSDKSVASGHSKKLTPSYKSGAAKSPALVGRVKSIELNLEDAESQSSSLAKLKFGPTPNNTPEEKATYSVVNQDGELEEFFKVDISIRGQTSYLPSEARRIHTPPLPSDNRDGKRRGFFFDYNLPQGDQKALNAFDHTQPAETSETQCKQASTNKLKSHPATISRRTSPEEAEPDIRVQTGDWYARQLVEIDSSSESDVPVESPQRESTGRKLVTTKFEVEQQRRLNEAQLDYNIPEHLSTSPLCPRHPRYWRVMKSKGSQFRGCWMHGFEEYSQAEKVKYGTVDRDKF